MTIWMKIPLWLCAASQAVNDMTLDLNSNGVTLAELKKAKEMQRRCQER
jgi:hypothetical protein